MTRKLWSFWLVVLVGAFAGEQGCNCGKGNIGKTPPGVCAKTTVCGNGEEYRKGECLTQRCNNAKANPNADCCPGQLCRFDGSCVDQEQNCEQDTDCNAGQTCQNLPEIDATKNVCSFPIPDANGGCPTGYVVFDKRCIRDLPCGGVCQSGQVCDIQLNVCEALPDVPTSNSNCNQTCATGQLMTYADPDSMIFHQCCALTCQCSTLPPLQIGEYGRQASAALASSEVVVASYNKTYGDLVVSHHSKVDGSVTLLEDVDGAPASGTLAGDPNGLRKGIKDAGVNVGQYSSVVVGTDGNPRVVYYDVDNQDLKYAEKTAGGWLVHAVDTAGDVGAQYSAMVVAKGSGNLRVTYLVNAGPKLGQAATDASLYTGLRYAESKTPSPKSASDWNFVDVDIQPVHPVPCGGSCKATEICVAVSTNPEQDKCGVTASDCVGSTPSGQICALPDGDAASGFYIQRQTPATQELPPSLGMFSSMAEEGCTLFISYYDNWFFKDPPTNTLTGTLKGAMLTLTSGSAAGATPTTFSLDLGDDCDPTLSPHDVGRFSSLAINSSGRIGIAYQESAAVGDEPVGKLRYWAAGTFSNAVTGDPNCVADSNNQSNNKTITIADNAIDTADSEILLVGANASLIFDGSGRAQISYQDSSNTVLKLASETGENTSAFKTQVIPPTPNYPSVGWFSRLLFDGGSAWVMHVHVGFDDNGNANDTILVQPITF